MMLRPAAALCGALMMLVAVPAAQAQSGIASVYGYRGGRTADGEHVSVHKFTAAHKSLPFGTHVRVTNHRNGRSVVCASMIVGRMCEDASSTSRLPRLARSACQASRT